MVLSHAHIDHAGRLPFLVRQGYQGTIWCTPATRDLCAVMLADSAHIQEKDAEFLAQAGQGVHRAAVCDAAQHADDRADDRCSVPQTVRCGSRGSRVLRRRRAHPRLGLGGAGLHRGQQRRGGWSSPETSAGPGCRSSAIPSRPMVRTSSSWNRRTAIVPRIHRRCAGAAGCSDSRNRSTRRPGSDSGIRGGTNAGAGVRPPRACRGGCDSLDPDLHRQPAGDRHDVGVRDASRHVRSRRRYGTNGSANCSDSSSCTTRVMSRSRRRSRRMHGPMVIIAASGMAESGADPCTISHKARLIRGTRC